MIKKILIAIAIILIIIQFFHPEKNNSDVQSQNINNVFPLSQEVKTILEKSCYDCHSNKTMYPWYFNLQPVAWYLSDHINEGKHELNFSEFAAYSPRRQFHKMEEIEEQINEDEMPMSSYKWIHNEAKLDGNQKQLLINWSKSIRDTLKAHNPPDSLVMKRR